MFWIVQCGTWFKQSFIILLTYCLGCLELKEDTIENLLAAACLLQLPQVVDVCCHFLMKLLHPSNCLGIRAFADAQGCIELMKVAHSYTMVSRFNILIRETEMYDQRLIQWLSLRRMTSFCFKWGLQAWHISSMGHNVVL